MALLVPTASENQMLETLLGTDATEGWRYRLYVNNYTPVDGSVAGDFTEMSTLGYSGGQTAASWSVTQNGSNKAEATATQLVWTFTAGTAVTVYGYYVLRASTLDLWFAERFPISRVVQNNGDTIRVTPKFTLSKE